MQAGLIQTMSSAAADRMARTLSAAGRFTRERASRWRGAAVRVHPGLIATAALLLASGCAAGPDFKAPAPPSVDRYGAGPLSATAGSPGVHGGQAQRFIEDARIPEDWWTLFHSMPLDELIGQALSNSPTLKAAHAALTAAREQWLAARGSYFPAAAVSLSASRQRQSEQIAPTPNANIFQYSLFTPQVTVSYAPDVFGLNRRTVESARAQAQAVRFQMLATYVTLSANVAAAAIQEAALRAQIRATQQLVALNRDMVRILRDQYAGGYASRADLAAQQAQLAQINATLPPLRKQLIQQRDLLAVLAGRYPGQASAQPFELADLQLPARLPVSLPAQLVKQRPDVLQAQANLHAASAEVGIAIANRLPAVQLTADAGSSALAISQLFTSATNFVGIAGALAAPIFQGGTLLHQERAARAAYVQAAQQYRATVLGACENVADTLAALQQDAAGLQAAATAAHAATLSLQVARRQVRVGYAGYLALLNAEQVDQQARMTLVQAEASRYLDTVALFEALGGGWWQHTGAERIGS
jgi:NodT family efflux transporter outer membrane factor (OMF) lipoprotein